MNIHIHAVETGYQCRYHERDGKARHAFHDSIDVVGNNGGKSIHRSCQDVAVNVYGIVCLF